MAKLPTTAAGARASTRKSAANRLPPKYISRNIPTFTMSSHFTPGGKKPKKEDRLDGYRVYRIRREPSDPGYQKAAESQVAREIATGQAVPGPEPEPCDMPYRLRMRAHNCRRAAAANQTCQWEKKPVGM